MTNKTIISQKIATLADNLGQTHNETLNRFMDWAMIEHEDFAVFCGRIYMALIIGFLFSVVSLLFSNLEFWSPMVVVIIVQQVHNNYMDSWLVVYLDEYIATFR